MSHEPFNTILLTIANTVLLGVAVPLLIIGVKGIFGMKKIK